ncbi:hypothetical protein [Dysgonomonas sp. 511]|uniref:hypothetical protein n=1 Tax=Dysgonomonas sp. 511 TaxID=2302930 RepID=UPI0013D38AC9|nr:hypothetical protein [Dysgonomonas sp. 511]
MVKFRLSGLPADISADNYTLRWYRLRDGHSRELISPYKADVEAGNNIIEWTSIKGGTMLGVDSAVAVTGKYYVELFDTKACNVVTSDMVTINVDRSTTPRIIARDCLVVPLYRPRRNDPDSYILKGTAYYYLPDVDLNGDSLLWFKVTKNPDGSETETEFIVNSRSGIPNGVIESITNPRPMYKTSTRQVGPYTWGDAKDEYDNDISEYVPFCMGRPAPPEIPGYLPAPGTFTDPDYPNLFKNNCATMPVNYSKDYYRARLKNPPGGVSVPADFELMFLYSSRSINLDNRVSYTIEVPVNSPIPSQEVEDYYWDGTSPEKGERHTRSWTWTYTGDDLGNMPVPPKEGSLVFPGFVPTKVGEAIFKLTPAGCADCAATNYIEISVYDQIEAAGGNLEQDMCQGAAIDDITFTSTRYNMYVIKEEYWNESGSTNPADFNTIQITGEGTRSLVIKGTAPTNGGGRYKMGYATIAVVIKDNNGDVHDGKEITLRWGNYAGGCTP